MAAQLKAQNTLFTPQAILTLFKLRLGSSTESSKQPQHKCPKQPHLSREKQKKNQKKKSEYGGAQDWKGRPSSTQT
jgi:hypothetical protein